MYLDINLATAINSPITTIPNTVNITTLNLSGSVIDDTIMLRRVPQPRVRKIPIMAYIMIGVLPGGGSLIAAHTMIIVTTIMANI